MRKLRQATAVMAVLTLTLSNSIYAAEDGNPTEKEEVIYIMTSGNGDIETVNAVNIFDSENVVDYGNYSNVKMLNTNDSISQSNDKITYTTKNGKTYYQGTMDNVEIPWNISIQYYLDGKELSASEVAGQSGDLTIYFKITKNENCTSQFFDDYALQSTFVLDTNTCSNIKAEGATIANVGENKQLSYTILPGKGIDAHITATVKDFEMDAVTINGVKLNLNISIDDSELMSKVKDLMSGISQVDSGAQQVSSGTDTLESGSTQLQSGASTLVTGSSSLDSGITSLSNGVNQLQEALNTLNSNSSNLNTGSKQTLETLQAIQSALNDVSMDTSNLQVLVEASNTLQTNISALNDNAALLYQSVNSDDFAALISGNTTAASGLDALADASSGTVDLTNTTALISELLSDENYASQASSSYAELQNIQTILSSLSGYSESLRTASSLLNQDATTLTSLQTGITGIASATSQLNTGYTSFNTNISNLVEQLSLLSTNLVTLGTVIGQLTGGYSILDTGIQSYTSGVQDIVDAYSELTDGVESLAIGSKQLVSGATTLKSGTDTLVSGVDTLSSGAKELADGTGELNSQTSNLDVQVEQKIDDMISSIEGNNSDIVSFTSSKNTNVDAVQFVIKTEAIQKEETQKEETQTEEDTSLWSKIKSLFN